MGKYVEGYEVNYVLRKTDWSGKVEWEEGNIFYRNKKDAERFYLDGKFGDGIECMFMELKKSKRYNY